MGADDAFGLVGHEIDQLRFDQVVDHGGFGIVYRGHHMGLDEPVAIKCLRLAQPLEPALAAQFRDRFRDETKIAYRLSQGNLDIVRSISSGTLRAPATGGFVPYMVLEWLEGRTLHAELKDRVQRGERGMTLDEAVGLLDSAVTAVAYAHEQGVVHRDLKPGNLFLALTRSGPRLKVLDFGLAKITNTESTFGTGVDTASGLFIASPSYAAPEQFERTYGEIGPWTDVYALALVLLEMMVGKKVRHARTVADALMMVASVKTAEPSASALGLHLPPGVDAVLARAVSRDAHKRPRDAAEFWGALRDGMLTMADLGATLANDRLPAAELIKQALAQAQGGRPSPAPAPAPPAPHKAEARPAAGEPPPASRRPEIPASHVSDPTLPLGSQAVKVPVPTATAPVLGDIAAQAAQTAQARNLSYTLPLEGANAGIAAAMQEVLANAKSAQLGGPSVPVMPPAAGAPAPPAASGAPHGAARGSQSPSLTETGPRTSTLGLGTNPPAAARITAPPTRPLTDTRSNRRPAAATKRSSAWILVVVLVVLAFGASAGAAYWLRVRTR